MATSINQVVIAGYVGGEPKFFNGGAIASISVATSTNWKDESGEWQSKTDWHNVSLFKYNATVAQNIASGDFVTVTGSIKYTKKDERIYTNIQAQTIVHIPKKAIDKSEKPQYQPQSQVQAAQSSIVDNYTDNDDMPF
jgi:single-strand DNA-binding protein